MSSSLKRLNKEYKDLLAIPNKSDIANQMYIIAPVNGDLHHWHAQIFGPKDTPYGGGFFKLDIKFTNNYPFKPPAVQFMTKIYHPNINDKGFICLDLLKDQWTPAVTIEKLLYSIISLLNDPNPKDPLAPEVATVYLNNIVKFKQTAKEWTIKYAQKNQ